jgi:hypothetical protein
MKKVLLPLVALALLAFAACSGGGGNDPKSVTKKFFEAFKTMNMDEAAKYATKESKGMLDMMKMGMSFAQVNQDSIKKEMDKQKIDFSDAIISGDTATVSVTVDGKDKTDFKLLKEEGQWKVAFDKNTLMKTGMEKMEDKGASQEELDEAKKAMDLLQNKDSLGKIMEQAGDAMKEAGKAMDSLGKKNYPQKYP